ncbi:MAG TPA: non-homologous end-joining DNA ligase [Actinomycetota bacterium]|nr:non-homologous end-joining DNA ligase [Actinomycetota bacterium]
MADRVVHVDGREVKITHPDKVLFPDDGITKSDLVDYLLKAAPLMLPHLRGRPLTLLRYPEGIGGGSFFQKAASSYFPDWIPRAVMAKQKGTTPYVVCNDAATLVYLANQNTVTHHVWLSRADRPGHPDQMMFDLDPPDDRFGRVRRVALLLKEVLDGRSLPSLVKTSGSRGLHVVVPLDGTLTTEQVLELAGDLAADLVGRDPDNLTTAFHKADRGGRIYVDIARNGYAQTAVAPYSVRALPGAPVAAPLEWREVENPRLKPQSYTVKNLFRRLAKRPDPWS